MQDLERAVRSFAGLDGAIRFASALGFEDVVHVARVPSDLGLGADDVASVARLARRDGLDVLLFNLTSEPEPRLVSRLARRVQASSPLRRFLFIGAGPRHRSIVIASVGLDGEPRELIVDRLRPRLSDLDTLIEMRALDGEGGTALALRYAHALDRSQITHRFFHDVRAHRARIAHSWTGIPARLAAERDQLALLLLCRLMFLYFLQGQGHLAQDRAYLANLFRRWLQSVERPGTFYRFVIAPLFFGALNTRPDSRGAAARSLGALPYLNGGLFECTALERRHVALDLPDPVMQSLFAELLERYRFTSRDVADSLRDGQRTPGIDPEMLGRVFEALMGEEQRGDTGTFYTPASVVDALVRDTLIALLVARGSIDGTLARDLVEGRRSLPDGPVKSRIARVLHDARVLDPACGSGAFLLGALSRIAHLRASLGDTDEAAVRREFVASGLHGVDIQHDAALLCALRLWLALTLPAEGGPVEPLPNLDRRIRQGDALLDPLDLATPGAGATTLDRAVSVDASVRRAVRALIAPSRSYTNAEPAQRAVLQRELAEGEATLARAWMHAIDGRLAHEQRLLEATRHDLDLFGEPTQAALLARFTLERVAARREEMRRLESALDDARSLPFFSFSVHFAETSLEGFDLVLSNPPWIRAHRWPSALGRVVRNRYAVCRDPGWRFGARLAGAPAAILAQVDLAMLFLERGLALLRPGGALGMLLPAKLLRSLYGGAARRMLLSQTSIASIDDHSLDQRSVFRADAFTVAIVAAKRGSGEPQDRNNTLLSVAGSPSTRSNRRRPDRAIRARAKQADSASPVRVRMVRRSGPPLSYSLPQSELPLFPGDDRSPWLLAPERARAALRRMQAAGPPLGTHDGLRVRRGVFTGANDTLLIRDVRPRIGGLASIRAEGWHSLRPGHAHRSRYEAVVEAHALRPVLRGTTIDAWAYEIDRWIVWTHDERGNAAAPPARLGAYLHRHRDRLDRRSGLKRDDPAGAIFRVSEATLGHKVIWHDLARTLEAVAVPARVRNALGFEAAIIPLNTAYFITVDARERALLLTAYLNSLPVRAFARTIAERAKDARFRFFAWTIAAVPLPLHWASRESARTLIDIADRAHGGRSIDARDGADLDTLVGQAYGLNTDEMHALMEFDLWLNG